MIKLPFILIIIFVNLSIGYAVEFAKLPYDTLYHLFLNQSDLQTNDWVIIKVASKHTEVSSDAISLHIIIEDEKIPVILDSHGLVNFPMQSEWLNKQAYLISNQPAGSLILDVLFFLPPYFELVNGQVSYQEIMQPLVNKMNLMKPLLKSPYVQYSPEEDMTLWLVGQNYSQFSATLSYQEETIDFYSNDNGFIQIPYHADWYKDNPNVSFYPEDIIIFLGQ